jgi:hypothetical protein
MELELLRRRYRRLIPSIPRNSSLLLLAQIFLVRILFDDRSAFSDFDFWCFGASIEMDLWDLKAVSLFDFDAVRSQRYIVAGSDASKKSFGSGLRVRHSQKLIPNAVAVMSLSPILWFLWFLLLISNDVRFCFVDEGGGYVCEHWVCFAPF